MPIWVLFRCSPSNGKGNNLLTSPSQWADNLRIIVMRIPALFCLILFGCVNDHAVLNLTCSAEHPVSWKNDVQSVITANCTISGCHETTNHSLPPLATLKNVQDLQGDVLRVVSDGSMPRGSSLSASEKFRITCWIQQGAKDN